MRTRLFVLAFLFASLALPSRSASKGRQPSLPRLEVGSWVKVKGRFESGRFEAKEVAALDEEQTSMKGVLDAWDPQTGVAELGPLRLEASKRASYRDVAGKDITARELAVGTRVKVKISLREDGSQRIKRIQGLAGSGSWSLRGRVAELSPQAEGALRFRLEGFDVELSATIKTRFTALRSPLLLLRSRAVEPERGIRLGERAILAGELRVDYGERDNYDLADQLDGDRATVRLRTELGLFFDATDRVTGTLGFKASHEQAVTDEADSFDTEELLELDETWFFFHGVLGRHGSLQLGRSHFEDDREWMYYGETEAIRLFFDFARFEWEVSAFEKFVDPEEHLEDLRGLLLRGRFKAARRHHVDVWMLDLKDSFSAPGSDGVVVERGFSPRYYGLSALGFFKPYLRYWFDAALLRGKIGAAGTSLKAHAYDLGLTAILPARWQPSLTLGLAVGSGDDDPGVGDHGNFHQSGMHRNNGKWNGVTNFRYYGELLRPELSNLEVTTIGLGLRPWARTSIDLVHHRYRLEEPRAQAPRTGIRGRTLDRMDRGLGEEWDLVIGIEKWSRFEFELDLSYFRPGPALLGPRDSAYGVSVKLKYLIGNRG